MLAEPEAQAASSRASIEAICESVVAYGKSMGALYDEIGALASNRAHELQALMLEIGRDMLVTGAKSRKVGNFVIRVGVSKVRICDCHGAYIEDCDTIGPVTILDRGYEPWIKVTDTRKGAEEEA